MSNLIISLSTIPPRMHKIMPTLRDLLNQSADVKEIRLNIPRTYRRFDFDLSSLPRFPDGIKVCFVDKDYGPATKVLPTIEVYRGQDVEILFCDDDQPYPKEWAQHFLDARALKPDCAITEKGYDLNMRPKGVQYDIVRTHLPRARLRRKGVGYRLFRGSTLTLIKPNPFTESGYVDIMEGYRGVMVRPEFIPKEAFNIPDILWTVDDPWLSGQVTANNVPIWLTAAPKGWPRAYGAHGSNPLGKFLYKGHGRLAADTAVIEYFRKNYGIWQDKDIAMCPQVAASQASRIWWRRDSDHTRI